MSLTAAIRELIDAGFSIEQALQAAEIMERHVVSDAGLERRRASDAERQRRHRESQRNVMSRDTVTECDEVKKRKEPKEKNNTPIPPLKGGTFPKNSEPEGFSDFWQAYPNKTGKPKALEAYRRATRTASAAEILAGLRRVLPGWDDPKFIPHPTTWLNREGWNDQPVNALQPAKPATPDAHTAGWNEDRWRSVIRLSNERGGAWDQRWGPPPDDPQTLCPPDLKPLWRQAA